MQIQKKYFVIVLLFVVLACCYDYASYSRQADVPRQENVSQQDITDEQRTIILQTMAELEKRNEERRGEVTWTSMTEEDFEKRQQREYNKMIILAIIINIAVYLLPFYVFRFIYRKPLNKLLSLVIVLLYSVTANVIICFILYGYYLYGSYPPYLWSILAYYFLVAKQPLFVPKPPLPEPPTDWKDY